MLKQLQKELSAEKKDKNVFDIVIYGSTVKGKIKPNDLDIAVIFRSGSLRERLDKLQQIKKRITLTTKIDLKGILWEELFQEEFFARSGLFLEGISLFDGHPLAERLGFYASSLFIYSLKDKSHTSKVKFNYLLNGRQGQGILKKMNGKWLSPGTVQIPIAKSSEFEEILQKNNINYLKKNILIQA
jgi:predicted nucleotidyltransferase